MPISDGDFYHKAWPEMRRWIWAFLDIPKQAAVVGPVSCHVCPCACPHRQVKGRMTDWWSSSLSILHYHVVYRRWQMRFPVQSTPAPPWYYQVPSLWELTAIRVLAIVSPFYLFHYYSTGSRTLIWIHAAYRTSVELINLFVLGSECVDTRWKGMGYNSSHIYY